MLFKVEIFIFLNLYNFIKKKIIKEIPILNHKKLYNYLTV